MSEPQECPECGEEFKSLGSHKNSLNCISTQHQQKRRREDLRSVPNSKKAVEWLEDSDFRLEELYRNPSSGNYKKNHYTTEQGIKALERNIFVNATYNGIRVEIKSRGDGYITCEVTGATRMFEDVIVIVPDDNADIGRRRVLYLKKMLSEEPHLAFTTDDERVGPAYNPEEAIEKIPECKPEIMATAV